MNSADFDREWRLGELLDARMLARIAPPLAELLGADLAILDRDGAALWGRPAAEARREALVLEIEPAGYLAATQTPDGTIHLLSSRLHYRFNLAWLRQLAAVPPPSAEEQPPGTPAHTGCIWRAAAS